MSKTPPRPKRSIRDHAPDAPPFIGLMLDEPTVRLLAEGVVNARAEVAARQALKDLEAATLGK